MPVILAGVFGVMGPIIIQIPFIGAMLFVLFVQPVASIYDAFFVASFIDTGEHIGFSPVGMQLYTHAAYYFYMSFFAILGSLLGLLAGWIVHRF